MTAKVLVLDHSGQCKLDRMEALGERPSLPPFLEAQRTAIERKLKPLL